MRNVSDKGWRENQNTHFMLSTFFENRVGYEITWNNVIELERPQMTIWPMHIACWVPKATNTLLICNTSCFSVAAMIARTHLDVTIYVYCLSCLTYIVIAVSIFVKILHKYSRFSSIINKDLHLYKFHIKQLKTLTTLRHVSIFLDHHQGAMFLLSKVIL